MQPIYILLIAIIVIAVVVALYYIYRQIIWTKINNKYAFGDFFGAIEEIDKLYKFATPSMRQKMIVYKASSAFLINDEDLFLKTINQVRRSSHTYGPYYFYYMLAYYIKKEDFVIAEKLYGDLTTKYKVEKELDLVTPLAILMANKGDKKAFKKLRELKRNKHIDVTFLMVANDFIRKNKNKDI